MSVTPAERELLRRVRWELAWEPILMVWLYYLATTRKWWLLAMFSLLYVAHIWRLSKKAAGIHRGEAPNVADLTPREAFWLDPGTAFRRLTGREEERASV